MIMYDRFNLEEENFMPDSEEEFQADLDAQDMRYLHYLSLIHI